MELANIEKRLEIIQRRKRLVEYQRDSRFSMRTELRNAVIDAEAEALNTDSLLTVLCSSLAEVFGNDAAMYALTIEEMDEEIGLLNGRTEQLNKALLSLNSNIIIPSFSPPVS